MSNDPLHGDGASRAWVRLAVGTAALALLASALPAPWALGDLPATGLTRPADEVETAVLVVASWLVWLLLLWAALVGLLACLTHLPGVVGRSAALIAAGLTPTVARRMLVAAVGTSLLAGVSSTVGSATHHGPADSHVAAGTGFDRSPQARPLVPVGPPVPPAAQGAWPALRLAQDRMVRPMGPANVGQPAQIRLDFTSRSAVFGTSAGPAAGPGDPPEISGAGQTGPNNRTGTLIHTATVELGRGEPTTGHPDGVGPPGGPAAAPTGAGVQIDWPGVSGSSDTDDTVVVVLRGDTLWAIAARHLPAGADDAQIDASWRSWYAANRDVVGRDPNLILPGQRLRPPAP